MVSSARKTLDALLQWFCLAMDGGSVHAWSMLRATSGAMVCATSALLGPAGSIAGERSSSRVELAEGELLRCCCCCWLSICETFLVILPENPVGVALLLPPPPPVRWRKWGAAEPEKEGEREMAAKEDGGVCATEVLREAGTELKYNSI